MISHRSSQYCCRLTCCRRAQLLLEEALLLLLTRRNTMNANTIKAAAKPLGMLAVRCPAPCVLFEYARALREKRRVDGVQACA